MPDDDHDYYVWFGAAGGIAIGATLEATIGWPWPLLMGLFTIALAVIAALGR